MSWTIEVKPTAERQYLRLNRKKRNKIKEALKELEKAEGPLFHKEIKPLTGDLKGGYRLRGGGRRFLFTSDEDEKMIYIYAILPRGNAC